MTPAQFIARADDVTFGILHSRFHERWSLRLGTSLEDRLRFMPTTTFETFPFPAGMTPRQGRGGGAPCMAPQIAAANIAAAYGWDDYTPEMPDEEILRRLLALNLERKVAERHD